MRTELAENQPTQPSITAENYAFLQRYIYRESGIVIDAGKHYLFEARLMPIAVEENLPTLNDLCNLLRATSALPLKNRVVESMTTNETLFFRDIALFDALQRQVFPELIAARRDTKRLSIWSAASSSGQEAYSIAMILEEMNLDGWQIQILGTDINQQILDKAVAGRYMQMEVNRGLPPARLAKHFTQIGSDWQLNGNLRSMVTFQQFDLRLSMRSLGPFDLVLCRNVLIYFDVDTKKRILQEMRKTMNSRGLLALGAAETTINLDASYSRVAFGSAALYQAP